MKERKGKKWNRNESEETEEKVQNRAARLAQSNRVPHQLGALEFITH